MCHKKFGLSALKNWETKTVYMWTFFSMTSRLIGSNSECLWNKTNYRQSRSVLETTRAFLVPQNFMTLVHKQFKQDRRFYPPSAA